jgi:hypothetical protein
MTIANKLVVGSKKFSFSNRLTLKEYHQCALRLRKLLRGSALSDQFDAVQGQLQENPEKITNSCRRRRKLSRDGGYSRVTPEHPYNVSLLFSSFSQSPSKSCDYVIMTITSMQISDHIFRRVRLLCQTCLVAFFCSRCTQLRSPMIGFHCDHSASIPSGRCDLTYASLCSKVEAAAPFALSQFT